MEKNDRVVIQCSGLDSEELFFQEQEQKRIRKLRELAEKEANQKYRDEHQYHCFRCGTASLAEIEHGDIKIDVCVNEGCGAVHLDPGELEALEKSSPGTVKKVRLAVLGIFS